MQRNKHSILDFCPRPAMKEMNVPIQKRIYLRAYCPDIYTVKKGVITQIDQVTSSSRAFAISDIEFVIFMGLRIDNEIKNTSRIGNKFPFLRSE